MTVTEQERVSAPDIERRDAREERARRASVLEAAALEIEMRGWSQLCCLDHRGNVCAVGAIQFALGDTEDNFRAVGSGDAYGRAAGAFGQNGRDLDLFNDSPGRTAEEVTFLLRWRAQEILDGR